MTIESLSDLARECYLGDDCSEQGQAQQAIADYNWVKENIIYRCSRWGVPGETLILKTGICGAKTELVFLTEFFRESTGFCRSMGLGFGPFEGRPGVNFVHTTGSLDGFTNPVTFRTNPKISN